MTQELTTKNPLSIHTSTKIYLIMPQRELSLKKWGLKRLKFSGKCEQKRKSPTKAAHKLTYLQ